MSYGLVKITKKCIAEGKEVEPGQIHYIGYTLAAMLCKEGKAEWADPKTVQELPIPLSQDDRFELVKDRVKRTGK